MRRAWAGVGLCAALAAGCTAGGTATPPDEAAGAEASLVATSSYGRHAAVRGKVDVRIANRGERAVEVETWQVRHPLFDVLPPEARPSTLPPDGAARIVPVPFGPPRCDRSAVEADGATVLLQVRDGSALRDVEVPLTDGVTGLVRAHRLACAAQAVTDVVRLDLVPAPAEGDRAAAAGPVLRAALVLERRGDGEAVVTEVGGNILFTVSTPAAQPLAVLGDGDSSAQVPLEVRASRCEAHALTESKTSYTFPVRVALDGAEPALVQVRASAAGEAALVELLTDTCGPGAAPG